MRIYRIELLLFQILKNGVRGPVMKSKSKINPDKVILYTVIGAAMLLAVICIVQMTADRIANQPIKEEFLEGPYSSEE